MDAIPLRLPFLLDGATGTQLRERGMPAGACMEQWVLEHPEILTGLQRDYVQAGAQVLYAPTFGANRICLSLLGAQRETEEWNRRLVELSREAAEGRALVAGNLSSARLPGERPGERPFEELVSVYAEQGRALDAAGVDLFAVETMADMAEARAAVIALREVSDKPVMVTFTVNREGEIPGGTELLAAYAVMEGLGAAAFGINCAEGPDSLTEGLSRLTPYTLLPLIAKPGAGLPVSRDGRMIYPWSAEEFAACLPGWAAAGARIFGGCCGTGPEHIRALREAVSHLDFARLPVRRRDEDVLLCATEKAACFISPVVDVSEPIECSPHMIEEILEVEETPAVAVKIDIRREEDLELFEESQYMIRDALCLSSDSPELLERALRLYRGRAFYDGTGDIEDAVLRRLERKYGLVVL